MNWKNTPVFQVDPDDIVRADYNLYQLLNISPPTPQALRLGVRNVAEAVTFDFFKEHGVGAAEAEGIIREDMSIIARKNPDRTDGQVLSAILDAWSLTAMQLGNRRGQTALAVGICHARHYEAGNPDARAAGNELKEAYDNAKSNIVEGYSPQRSTFGVLRNLIVSKLAR